MYYNVQVLRAVAAILVVWAHLRELFPSITTTRTSRPVGGRRPVLRHQRLHHGRQHPGRRETPLLFLWKRFARVARFYYLFTVLVFAITLIAPWFSNSSTRMCPTWQKSIGFIPFYKSPDRIYPTFYLGDAELRDVFSTRFSLSVWSFPERAGDRIHRRDPRSLRHWVCCRRQGAGSAPFYTFTRPIMLDFVMGMMIGLASERLGRLAERLPQMFYVALGVGTVWFLTGIDGLTLSSSTPAIAPPTDTVIEFGLGSAFIVMSAVALERSGRIVRNPTLLLVGNASFSLTCRTSSCSSGEGRGGAPRLDADRTRPARRGNDVRLHSCVHLSL